MSQSNLPKHGLPMVQQEADRPLQVGDLAKATGKTVRAIHLYEDLGLLRPQERSKGRFRLYGAEAVRRVMWISKLQSLGLSLAEIQDLAEDQKQPRPAPAAAERLRGVYEAKLEEVRSKLQDLTVLEKELEASLAFLDDCGSTCHTKDSAETCSSCSLHHELDATPVLVAGVHAH